MVTTENDTSMLELAEDLFEFGAMLDLWESGEVPIPAAPYQRVARRAKRIIRRYGHHPLIQYKCNMSCGLDDIREVVLQEQEAKLNMTTRT